MSTNTWGCLFTSVSFPFSGPRIKVEGTTKVPCLWSTSVVTVSRVLNVYLDPSRIVRTFTLTVGRTQVPEDGGRTKDNLYTRVSGWETRLRRRRFGNLTPKYGRRLEVDHRLQPVPQVHTQRKVLVGGGKSQYITFYL